jgi:hypothetical protein
MRERGPRPQSGFEARIGEVLLWGETKHGEAKLQISSAFNQIKTDAQSYAEQMRRAHMPVDVADTKARTTQEQRGLLQWRKAPEQSIYIPFWLVMSGQNLAGESRKSIRRVVTTGNTSRGEEIKPEEFGERPFGTSRGYINYTYEEDGVAVNPNGQLLSVHRSKSQGYHHPEKPRDFSWKILGEATPENLFGESAVMSGNARRLTGMVSRMQDNFAHSAAHYQARDQANSRGCWHFYEPMPEAEAWKQFQANL